MLCVPKISQEVIWEWTCSTHAQSAELMWADKGFWCDTTEDWTQTLYLKSWWYVVWYRYICVCMCVSILYIHSLPRTPSPNHWLVLLSPRPLLLWRLRKSSRCLSDWEIQQLLLVLSVLTHIFMFLSHFYVSSSLPASSTSSVRCHFIYCAYLIFFFHFSLCLSLYIPPLYLCILIFCPLALSFFLFCFSLHTEQWMSCFPPPKPPEF